MAGEEPPPQPFAKFGRATDYLTDFEGFQTFTTGGGTKNLFWHNPEYAAVQFCTTLEVDAGRGSGAADAALRPARRRSSSRS